MSVVETANLDVWSARPCPTQVTSSRTAESVILVPDGTNVSDGFDIARRACETGVETVRLVGHGVTHPDCWPAWSKYAPRLLLTEIDAYVPLDRASVLTAPLDAACDWIRSIFGGAFEDIDSAAALRASVANRLLLGATSDLLVATGITARHGADRIVCCDPKWPGLPYLHALVADRGEGGTVTPGVSIRRPRRGWRLRFIARAASGAIAAVLLRLVEFQREGRARQEVRTLARNTADPSLWIGVMGDSPEYSRHVIDTVATVAAERDEPIGVLLQHSIQPGHRRDGRRWNEGRALFPTLDSPALRKSAIVVEQCAAAERVGPFLTNLVSSLLWTARVSGRFLRSNGTVPFGSIQVPLDDSLEPLSRLATIDLLRGREALLAARSICRRRAMRGTNVIFAHASIANVTIPDLVLQKAGALTYELVHGAFGDRSNVMTYGFSNSSVRIAWSCVEAEALARYMPNQRCIGGYVPRLHHARRAQPRTPGPLRILALTNYAHGFGTRPRPSDYLKSYQQSFFDALLAAVTALGEAAVVRWRPHPHDDPQTIEDWAARMAPTRLELSMGKRPLDEDLRWCDAVVTSWSSTVLEALMHPVPVFVHDVPLYEPAMTTSAIAVERVFRNEQDLVPRFVACMRALKAQTEGVLAPERELRRRFFGSDTAPKRVEEVFWPATTREPAHAQR